MAFTKIAGPGILSTTDTTVGHGTYTGNLQVDGNISCAGTISYQDVSNIDSVGIITAQAGIHLGIGATVGKVDAATGITTFSTSVGIADSIFHIGNNDTSIRFPGDDIFAVETAGSERFRIHENGNISAGFDNDSYELSLQGASGGAPTLWLRDASTTGNPRILFGDTGNAGQGGIYYKNNGDSLNFYTNGNLSNGQEKLTILSGGGVGIGESIYHLNDTDTQIFFGTNSVTVKTAGQNNVGIGTSVTTLTSPSGYNTIAKFQHQGNSGYGNIILDRFVNAFIIDNDPSNASNDESYFAVKNKGVENIRILHDGKVGIGVTDPDALLHLKSASSPTIHLEDTSQTTKLKLYAQDSSAVVGTYTNHDLILTTNSASQRLFISKAGNIGIATNNPLSLLDVWGANGAGQIRFVETNHTNANRYGKVMEYAGNLYFQSRNDSSDGVFIFRGEDGTDTAEFLRIDSSGRVLVGTTTEGHSNADDLIEIYIKKDNLNTIFQIKDYGIGFMSIKIF